MRIDGLTVEGLRGAHDWRASDLGRSVWLPDGPQGMAVADALALVAASLDADRCEQVLQRMQLYAGEHEVFPDDSGFPEQVIGLEVTEVDALLDPEAGRKVVLTARVTLDPPLFGRLRDESMRDPRMLAALGDDPSVTLKIGWLFSTDRAAASVGVLEVRVAKTSFPTGRTERPGWMDGMLGAIGRRIGGVGAAESASALAARLLEASMSSDPDLRARFARLCEAMDHAPFALGRLELLRRGGGVDLAFGADLVRARQLGPRALRAVRVAAAALIDAPDVLVVEDDVASEWFEWLDGLTQGDGATLEQVWVLPRGG